MPGFLCRWRRNGAGAWAGMVLVERWWESIYALARTSRRRQAGVNVPSCRLSGSVGFEPAEALTGVVSS